MILVEDFYRFVVGFREALGSAQEVGDLKFIKLGHERAGGRGDDRLRTRICFYGCQGSALAIERARRSMDIGED